MQLMLIGKNRSFRQEYGKFWVIVIDSTRRSFFGR